MKLIQGVWWDNNDPEHLVYFCIRDENTLKQVWQSSWYDVRDLLDDDGFKQDFKRQVKEACQKYKVINAGNLDSNDYGDWVKHS